LLEHKIIKNIMSYNNNHPHIDPIDFHKTVKKMRDFFEGKGFIEVHTQARLSILAACEDPTTISTYNYGGQVWPLPQTGQMWLEYELLKNPEAPGFFCLSTSFRNEPNPVPGRHDKIFPMFEFEIKGGMDKLMELERELCEHMGFGSKNEFVEEDYDVVAHKYKTDELEHEHETQIETDYGKIFLLKNFPNTTSPFWNMKQNQDGKHANKVDVIIHGVETIGSAERSCDPNEMRNQFYKISEGGYANILFSNFTKERVEKELEEFLEFEFFERSGGGIGVTRMIRALKLSHLL
jgi:aspartyl/asparaginyl-tRNA synthetase